jgi:dihydropteroate synthase
MTTDHYPSYDMAWGRHHLSFGPRTLIMGVLNVTPDSFSDGGKFFSAETAVAQGLKLVSEGADILDIGGESTRPFSDPVPADEEIRRVTPVIAALAEKTSVPISIDTNKADVAREAIRAGASIINDVSALRMDPKMAAVAAETGVPVVLMHMKGTPKTMQSAPIYENLMEEITGFLSEAMAYAVENGIHRSKIILDPGIGFGKALSHNLQIMKELQKFQALDCPLLVGASRKTFLRKLLVEGEKKDLPATLPMVETATQASVAAAIMNGAHVVRVHDVAGTRTTARIIDAIKTATPSREDLD